MIFWPLKIAMRIISMVITVVMLYFAVTFVQIWLTSHHHSTSDASAILVFGTTEDNGTPSPVLQARLNEALVLYRAHRAPWVVVTGGKRPGDVYTEAGVSARFLEARGVPASRILKGYGNDSWQNVATAIGAMRVHHLTSVLVVTDPFHEDRAMAIASSEGLITYPTPVPSSPTLKGSLWLYYLKETLAVGVGRVVGYSTLSAWTTAAPWMAAPFGG